MFERYSESARRALFFARYEVSEQGGLAIDTEHLLLGVMREGAGLAWRALGRADVPRDSLREELRAAAPFFREKVATSVEMPFADATQRVRRFTVEEADRMGQTHIGPEHLLLGLLRETGSVAASTLVRHGVTLDGVRQDIVAFGDELGTVAEAPTAMNVEAAIDHIKELVADLGQLSAGASSDVQMVAADMVRAIEAELDRLKRFLVQ